MFNPLSSRSIISDKIYKKFSQTAYDLHKQKLQQIYSKKSTPKSIQQNQEQSRQQALRMVKNRKAYESCHSKIDPQTQLENKKMIFNILKIQKRRSMSQTQIRIHKNHYVENQKKQINQINRKLLYKIAEATTEAHKSWKNILKDQHYYEEKKNMLRKLKYQSPAQQKKSPKHKKSTPKKVIQILSSAK